MKRMPASAWIFAAILCGPVGCGNGAGDTAETGDAESGDVEFAHDPDACTDFSVPSRFGYRWDKLNHRLSVWEMGLNLDPDGCDGDSLAVGMIGGDFTQGSGVSDDGRLRYAWQPVRGEIGGALGAARQTFSTVLNPADNHAHEGTVVLSREDLNLREYEEVIAFVGGFGLNTGTPTQPPEFPATYDPEHGYVVRGLGVEVEVVALDDSEVTLRWAIRFEPGLSDDRPDLNDALPFALIDASVDVVFVGVSGNTVQTGSVDYQNDYEKQPVAMEMLLDHPSEADQTIALSGTANAGAGLWGLTRFDWSFDPEEMAGGGHYMREFDINLVQANYDDATGEATFLMDGFASNSSQIITSFALRSHFVGAMAWIQADDVGDAQVITPLEMPGYFDLPLP